MPRVSAPPALKTEIGVASLLQTSRPVLKTPPTEGRRRACTRAINGTSSNGMCERYRTNQCQMDLGTEHRLMVKKVSCLTIMERAFYRAYAPRTTNVARGIYTPPPGSLLRNHSECRFFFLSPSFAGVVFDCRNTVSSSSRQIMRRLVNSRTIVTQLAICYALTNSFICPPLGWAKATSYDQDLVDTLGRGMKNT